MRSLLRVAARNVTRNTRRSVLAAAAIFLAVGVLLSIRGTLNGLQDSLRHDAIFGALGALQIHRTGYMKQVIGAPLDLDLPADDQFLEKIRSAPHVVAAVPRLTFSGMASFNDASAYAVITATDFISELEVCPRRGERIDAGVMPDGSGGAGALASELLLRLRAQLGGKVAFLASDRDGVLNAVEVNVAGALGLPGSIGVDSKVAMIPLSLGQELVRMPGRATEIAVAIDDLENLEAARRGLTAVLGPEYEVVSWNQVATYIEETLQHQEIAISVIALVFLVVALFGIANTMLMSVLERTREIGTLMAIGIRRRQIVLLFLLEAALLAAIGASAGAAVGGGLVAILGHSGLHARGLGGGILHIYPTLSLRGVAFAVLVTSVGSMAAAVYPAWKAARMRPVEALSRI